MLTLDQRLDTCKKCTNRKMNFDKGLVCGLTEEKPVFETSCEDYLHDETVRESAYIPHDQEKQEIHLKDLKTMLSAETFESLRNEQNLKLGTISACVAALAGAILWAAITLITNYQIGYMAIGVGALTGICMRKLGKGIDQIYGIIGGSLAFLGCLLGNIFFIVGYIAKMEGISYFTAFMFIDYSLMPQILIDSLSPFDILFYGLAIYAGFKFSFRRLSDLQSGIA